MNTSMKRKLSCLALSLVAIWPGAAARGAGADFRLREHIGREWKNELVRFPLTAGQLSRAKAGHALLGPGGRAVRYQLVATDKPPQTEIAMLVDLPALADQEYRFADKSGAEEASGRSSVGETGGEVVVEETPDLVVITNSRTGIRLAKSLKDGRGPFAGVRLASGAWVGTSRLLNQSKVDPVVEYSVEVTVRGPIVAEVRCRLRTDSGGDWRATIRLDANEPVVLVDETTVIALPGDSLIRLDLASGFEPDRLLFRHGKGDIHRNAVWPIEPGEVYVLEPWLRWWLKERQGNCCSFFRQDRGDLLTLAAREAGAWIEPYTTLRHAPQGMEGEPAAKPPTSPLLTVRREGRELQVDLPLRAGQRKWMLTATDKAGPLEEMSRPDGHHRSLEPYRLLVKHGHFPLDRVKDYVLAWDDSAVRYPHLLLTPEGVARLRQVPQGSPAKAAGSHLRNPNAMSQFSMDDPVGDWVRTGGSEVGRYLARSALNMMQKNVEALFDQPHQPLGAAPHRMSELHAAMLAADVALATGELAPPERKKLLAQAAFVAYTLTRADFWSPERGYAANPNMTTAVYGYQASAACLLSSHPMSRAWAAQALGGLRGMLSEWSDEGGGWLEAPHYAMYAYDTILGGLLMARNAGLGDHLDDPRLKTVVNWFSKISTPPDSRIGGFRHLPPAGNTYLHEASGEFGILAFLFRKSDPAFSAQQQWMFRQQRSWPSPGVGGAYPAFAGFRRLLSDPDLPAQPPPWTSELFPKTGLVLRGAYGGDRETYLYMIQGVNHAHYDDDSGSVIVWGKGRVISDDFGYYNPSAEDHNLVQSAQAGSLMHVKEFVPGPIADFARGSRGGWTRQIILIKSPDPLGPNYFVFCDSLAQAGPAAWRLHAIADKVTTAAGQVTIQGLEDVDADLVFVQRGGLEVKTQPKTRKSGSGILPDGRSGAVTMSQIEIRADYPPGSRALTAVLYPRLKTQAPPKVTPLGGGKGLKIEHPPAGGAAGRSGDADYVFLAPERFTFREGEIAFDGTAGVIRLRGGKAEQALGGGGSLRYGSEKIEKTEH